jgi:hypothetical protein
MPIPEGFSEFENLQDLVRIDHNRRVQNWFKNQQDNDVSTPKARLKHTCLIKDGDTANMTLMRMWLFEITAGHAAAIQTPIYGIPVQELQSNAKFRPQVKLYFKEDFDNETHSVSGVPRLEGEITFRLMDVTSETISRAKAESLALKIKNDFAVPIFVWEKGWFKCTYMDAEKGYDMRLLVKSKVEGERVVKQVLGIQNDTFDRDNFQFVDHDRTYSLNPGTHRVYGKTVKKPIQRRRADVKFRYAQLIIHGQPNPVNLVAVGGRLRSVIQRV